jgi:hypothetical protein
MCNEYVIMEGRIEVVALKIVLKSVKVEIMSLNVRYVMSALFIP